MNVFVLDIDVKTIPLKVQLSYCIQVPYNLNGKCESSIGFRVYSECFKSAENG